MSILNFNIKKLFFIILLFLSSCDSINSSSTIYINSNEQVLNIIMSHGYKAVVLKDTVTNTVYMKQVLRGKLREPTLIIKTDKNTQ